MAAAGCGGSSGSATKINLRGISGASASSPAELRLQREDFILVSHELALAEGSIAREVAAAKAAWPIIAQGLPTSVSPAARGLIATAKLRAQQIRTPRFIAHASELTGPASGVAGLLLSFEGLARRGWTLTLAAIDGTEGSGHSPQTVSYLRSNAALYIGSVYDAHYNLSVLGKALQTGYEALGGGAVFGRALQPATVQELAAAFSPSTTRLSPPPPRAE